jgi:DNA-directed RNA polymerase subunit M/transcription elongation factor TFIIS
MDTVDAAGEWRRLAEHYRQLTDSELIDLARNRAELTAVAQQCLSDEVSVRRLKIEPVETEERRPAMVPEPPDSLYAEERSLVTLCTVWSVGDALQIQSLLDRAGIPFCMGKERATSVDRVTSSFAEGVPVGVMRVGWPWASGLLRDYFPKDVPASEKNDELPDIFIRCPKCKSEEVVFEHMQDEDPATHQKIVQKYEWKCDSCGYEWEDDGVAGE